MIAADPFGIRRKLKITIFAAKGYFRMLEGEHVFLSGQKASSGCDKVIDVFFLAAKENNGEFEEESLINPTQPNLWEDNEEE